MSEYIYGTDEHKGHWLTGEEIVRCKSCKYYDECWTSEVYPNRHWCDKLAAYMPPNGFCSLGRRDA